MVKVVIGKKNGKSFHQELDENQFSNFISKKIGDKVSGSDIGFEGYEFDITGGSDSSGTPMRKDVEGTSKKKIYAVSGIGLKKKRRGQRQKKTVSGNTISENTSQINLKVTKEGKKPLGEEETKEENTDKQEEKTDEKKENKE